MSHKENQEVSFLKDGGDEEFDNALKNIQNFSSNMIEKKEENKIEYEAHDFVKSLDHYYDKKMNFENNEMITPPENSMNKLDKLYDRIMESKIDKNLFVEKNTEYMGDPKEEQPLSKKNTLKSNSNKQSKSSLNSIPLLPNSKEKNGKKASQDIDLLEMQTLQTQEPNNFDQSYYDYPVMNTPSYHGSFAANDKSPEVNPNLNQMPYQNNLYVQGIPRYDIPNQPQFYQRQPPIYQNHSQIPQYQTQINQNYVNYQGYISPSANYYIPPFNQPSYAPKPNNFFNSPPPYQYPNIKK